MLHVRSHMRAMAWLVLLFSGCAGFNPTTRFQDLVKSREATAKQVVEALEISVEEFANAKKSRLAFDENLPAYKVLPLLLRVENKGDKVYRMYRRDIKAFLKDEALTPMTSREAADESVASEYAGKALGWTLATGPFAILFWPATTAASARHTHGVNQRVYQHFDGTQFNDGVIKAGETVVGFVYFKIPTVGKKLEGLRIELNPSLDNSDSRLSITLQIPPIDVES